MKIGDVVEVKWAPLQVWSGQRGIIVNRFINAANEIVWEVMFSDLLSRYCPSDWLTVLAECDCD